MHRSDNSLYLLYIEPKKEEKLTHPINDMLTQAMQIAIQLSISGAANYHNVECNGKFYHGIGYMGFHVTKCDQWSDNHDYLLKSGHITNSLATFYLQWYRNSIPKTEWSKLADVLYYNIQSLNYERQDIYKEIDRLRAL